MGEQEFRILLAFLRILVPLIIAGWALFLLLKMGPSLRDMPKRIQKGINSRVRISGNYSKQQRHMSKIGVMYQFGDYNMSPGAYIFIRLGIGVLVGLILFDVTKSPLSALGIFAGYVAVEWVFGLLNTANNEDLMMDLYNTYANLKIQLDAGIYIAQCLEYIARGVQNDRYKAALSELVLNMSDKTISMQEAIDTFQNRFESADIDKLCNLLSNVVNYGTDKSYTSDIMGEVQNSIAASTLKAEHDVEQKAGVINFAFFTVVIFIVAYATFMSFAGLDLF